MGGAHAVKKKGKGKSKQLVRRKGHTSQPSSAPASSSDELDEDQAISAKLGKQISDQLTKMEDVQDAKEKLSFKFGGKSFDIFLRKSKPNGRCLFESLAVQHCHRKLNDEDVLKFKASLICHIEKNFDKFKTKLRVTIEENPKYVNATNAVMDDLCKDHLQLLKENDREWGGAESIAAFADLHQTNVLRFVGTSYGLVEHNEKYDKIAIIRYTGDHYDGVQHIPKAVIDIISNKLAQDFETDAIVVD